MNESSRTGPDLGPLFDAQQVRTDDEGRHVGSDGREWVAVEAATGEVDFVPMPGQGGIVATWARPSWATNSTVGDVVAEHARPCQVCGQIGQDGGEVDLPVWVMVADTIETGGPGEIRAVRESVPVVAVGEVRLTLTHAAGLVRALTELVEAATG